MNQLPEPDKALVKALMVVMSYRPMVNQRSLQPTEFFDPLDQAERFIAGRSGGAVLSALYAWERSGRPTQTPNITRQNTDLSGGRAAGQLSQARSARGT